MISDDISLLILAVVYLDWLGGGGHKILFKETQIIWQMNVQRWDNAKFPRLVIGFTNLLINGFEQQM